MEEKHFGMDDEFGFRYVMFGVFVDYIIAKSSMQLAIQSEAGGKLKTWHEVIITPKNTDFSGYSLLVTMPFLRLPAFSYTI